MKGRILARLRLFGHRRRPGAPKGHGYGSASNYMTRRRWDDFVQHLLGMAPREYVLQP